MAEEVKDPIIDEEAQLKAQLDAIKRAEQPDPPAEAAAAEPIPPVEEPAVEAKPEEKPVEAKPAEEPRRDGAAWKLLRQKEKELKEAQTELDARRARDQQQTADPNKEPDFETQPADYLKKRTEHTDAELAAIRQELANRQQQDNYQRYIDGIKQQESVFEQDHPDYRKATAYLIDKDIKQWERAGLSVIHTNQVLQYAHSNDPQYAPYKRNVERLVGDAGVIAFAEKEGRDVEEVAAYVTARDTWLTQRRDLLAQGAQARGVSVAQSAYEEAMDRGWNGNPQDGNGKEKAALARVQQAKDVAAASRSLSDSPSAEAGPEVRVLKNRNQVLDLDEESLDALIKSGNYRSL